MSGFWAVSFVGALWSADVDKNLIAKEALVAANNESANRTINILQQEVINDQEVADPFGVLTQTDSPAEDEDFEALLLNTTMSWPEMAHDLKNNPLSENTWRQYSLISPQNGTNFDIESWGLRFVVRDQDWVIIADYDWTWSWIVVPEWEYTVTSTALPWSWWTDVFVTIEDDNDFFEDDINILEWSILPASIRSFEANMLSNWYEASIERVSEAESWVWYYRVKWSINWDDRFEVCTQPAEWNSTEQQIYSCMLNLKEQGIITNRIFLELTAVDLDATEESFQIITLQVPGVDWLVKLAPNPATDYVRIISEWWNLWDNTVVTLYDINGRTIVVDTVVDWAIQYDLSLDGLKAWVYIVDINGVKTRVVKR